MLTRSNMSDLSSRSSGSMFAVLAVLAALAGCGGDDKTPPPTITPQDGGQPEDSGGFDARLPPPPPKDSGPIDIGDPDAGLIGRCTVDAEDIFVAVKSMQPLSGAPLAVDPVRSTFALPFIGTSEACLDAIYLASLAGGSSAPPPSSELVIDECSLPRTPVATATEDGWLLAAVDNRQPPYDVWVQPFDTAAGAMGEGQRISESAADETAVALVTLRDGNTMVAWADMAGDGIGSLHVRPLDATGKPRGAAVLIDTWKASAGDDPVTNPKLAFGSLVLASLGAEGAALAYWRYDPLTFEKSQIVFRALDADGTPVRDEWVLTGNAGPLASVDMDIGEDGGGIVYTQREAQTGRQVWFRQITDTGEPAPLTGSFGTAPAIRIVNSPFMGIDVSITKLFSSYAVAYRSLPLEGVVPRAEIRVVFLNRVGDTIGESDVDATSNTGGRTAIKVAYDGRIVLAWTEVTPMGENVIKVVRLPCAG